MADKKVYMADAAAKLIPPSAYYLAKAGAPPRAVADWAPA